MTNLNFITLKVSIGHLDLELSLLSIKSKQEFQAISPMSFLNNNIQFNTLVIITVRKGNNELI